MTVGERIKQMRERAKMSQDELAKRMGYKDRSSISKIEKSSDENLSLDIVQRAAGILNCSPLYLMGWSDDSKTNKPEEQEEHFINMYHQLNEEQKQLIDNLLTSLVSRK